MAQKLKGTSYRERLLKTPEQFQAEQIDSNVEQASIAMKMGLLSVDSEISKANGNVLQMKAAVSNSQLNLEKAKQNASDNLVNSLVKAFQDVKQQELNLQAAEESLVELKDLKTFLEETQKELF